MPTVKTPTGDKHFSYTRSGRAAAKAYAHKQGYDIVEGKKGQYKAKKRKEPKEGSRGKY